VKTNWPLPLSMQITDRSQPFPLRFAQEAAARLAEFKTIHVDGTRAGIKLSGAAERDLVNALDTLKMTCPDAIGAGIGVTYGDVVGELNRRKGLIEEMQDHEGGKLVIASAPLAGMLGLEAGLGPMTRGCATVDFEWIGYQPGAPDESPPPRRPAARA
jgi:hypothetical protein